MGFMPKLRACKGVLFVMAAFLSACGPQSPVSFLNDADSQENADEFSPFQILKDNADEFLLRVKAKEVQWSKAKILKANYTRIHLPGFQDEMRPGLPSLPTLTAHIIVPNGTELKMEILGGGTSEVLKLKHDLVYVDRPMIHSDSQPAQVQRNSAAYHMIHGAEAAEVVDVSYAGPDQLATIKINPLRYDPLRKELEIRRDFKVRITFVKTSASHAATPPVSTGGTRVAHYISINQGTEVAEPSRDVSRVDLVIAHESHREALARFVNYKKDHGRDVREHYVTGKTSAQIKAIISTEFASDTPPSNALLVGNISQIPSWRGSSDNSWTDYNYTTLDSGSVPDISLGRIPAHNADELNAFIDKAIAREEEERNNDDILLTAGKDVSLGCPANVTRVGEKIKPAAPTVRIIKKYRSEGVTTEQVIAAYNAAPNIIVYDGHGNQRGMTEIPLLISKLEKLTNDRHPIIFDIACLNANWRQGANARNFAEQILLRESFGAAGILASGGSGYGHDFFQTMGSLMATARQKLNEGDQLLNEVGQVILAAKIRHGSQDRSFWNYYGDPASTVWSNVGVDHH